MDGANESAPIVVVLIVALIYFLPSLVAMFRGHASGGGIFVLNLFLGWTFIGWLAALIWAASNARSGEQQVAITNINTVPQFVHSGVSENTPPSNSLLIGSDRKCPMCAEIIKAEARKCRHCREYIEPIVIIGQAAADDVRNLPSSYYLG